MSKSHLAAAVIASALFLSACGGDPDPEGEAGEPTSSETSSETSTDSTTPAVPAEPEEPTTPVEPDGPVESGEPLEPVDPEDSDDSDDSEAPDTPAPADAAELCAVFETAYAVFLEVDFPTGPNEPVDPKLVEAFHKWGSDLEDVSIPDAFTDDQRAGVDVMARVLQALPDDATTKDLEQIEDELDAREEEQAQAVSDYVDANCDLT